MHKLSMSSLIALWLFAFSTSWAQKFEYVNSTLWGWMNSVAIQDNYAYVAFVNGLGVFDISDKSNPTLISQLYLPGRGEGIAVKGHYAYLAAGFAGLKVVDITDIHAPRLANSCSLSVFTRGVYIEADYAFVVGNDLHIINVSNPESAFVVGSVVTQGQNSFSVVIKGDYAFMADENAGLQIINIEDKVRPFLMTSMATYGWTYDLAQKGNYLYMAEGYVGGFVGLQCIDISNPLKPLSLDSCWTRGWAMTVALAGNYAYVPENSTGGFPSLGIIDINDPSNLTLSRAPDTVSGVNCAEVVGDYLYLIGSEYAEGSFEIYNVRNRTYPQKVGHYDAYEVMGIYADSSFCYVGAGTKGGLRIIDIGQENLLKEISSIQTSNLISGVWASGHYVYAVGYKSLGIFDVSSRIDPKKSAEFNFSTVSSRLSVVGGYAYVADGYDGVRIFDISDPLDPIQIGHYPPSQDSISVLVMDVFIRNQYAFAAGFGDNLSVIDISDSRKPTQVGHFSLGHERDFGGAMAIDVVGDFAYLAFEYFGLAIVDIRNPENPVLMGAYQSTYRATDVDVSGDYAYFTDWRGVHLIDITNPRSPTAVAHFDPGGGANRVFILGDDIYLAADALIKLRLVP